MPDDWVASFESTVHPNYMDAVAAAPITCFWREIDRLAELWPR